MIFYNEKNNARNKINVLYSRCEFNSQWDTCYCFFLTIHGSVEKY